MTGPCFSGPSPPSRGLRVGPSPGRQSPRLLSGSFGPATREGLVSRAVVALVLGGGPGRGGESFETRLFLTHAATARPPTAESVVARTCLAAVSLLEGADPLSLASTNERLPPAFPPPPPPAWSPLAPCARLSSFFCQLPRLLGVSRTAFPLPSACVDRGSCWAEEWGPGSSGTCFSGCSLGGRRRFCTGTRLRVVR